MNHILNLFVTAFVIILAYPFIKIWFKFSEKIIGEWMKTGIMWNWDCDCYKNCKYCEAPLNKTKKTPKTPTQSKGTKNRNLKILKKKDDPSNPN